MKKLQIILGIVLFVFGIAIVGTIFFDKKMKEDEEFMKEIIEITSNFDDYDSDASSKGSSRGIETEVSEERVQLKNDVNAAGNPETDIGGFKELQMDGSLSEDDWQRRLDAGITTAEVNRYDGECKGLYYFDLLDSFDKQLYLEMYIILKNYETNVCLCSIDDAKIDNVFSCVLFDHPEIFYTSGYVLTKYTIKDEVVRYAMSPMYTMEKAEAEECRGYVDEYTKFFLDGINIYSSDYEKIKYTYEFVIINTEYDLNSKENQNILSVMMYGKSVCQGYARTIQYLLSQLGVTSTIVSGYVESGEGHAWNLVKCNNAWYYLDSTWGDSSYLSSAEPTSMDGISYDYMNITTAELEKNHIIDNIAEVPLCVFTQDNYYVREGLYFNSVDANQLEKAFSNAYLQGKGTISIKCANSIIYNDMLKYLIEDNHVFDYLKGKDKITYYSNDELCTYSFTL